MIKMKYNGFTLPEVLITLTVVAALAALVLPGLIKDMNNKAMVALLQGTVANINDAVQQELLQSGAKNIQDTMMYYDPEGFMRKKFTIVKECEATADTPCRGAKYTNLKGGTGTVGAHHPKLLSNGVSIDLSPESPEMGVLIQIDTNGRKAPNIIGVDLFYLYIVGSTDVSKGLRMGDVKGILQSGISDDSMTVTNERLKELCVKGWGTPCYMLLERSGFDPNYLENDYGESDEDADDEDTDDV